MSADEVSRAVWRSRVVPWGVCLAVLATLIAALSRGWLGDEIAGSTVLILVASTGFAYAGGSGTVNQQRVYRRVSAGIWAATFLVLGLCLLWILRNSGRLGIGQSVQVWAEGGHRLYFASADLIFGAIAFVIVGALGGVLSAAVTAQKSTSSVLVRLVAAGFAWGCGFLLGAVVWRFLYPLMIQAGARLIGGAGQPVGILIGAALSGWLTGLIVASVGRTAERLNLRSAANV
jgi:hypothetical protein